MNRSIYSFGASVSVMVCMFAELAFSGALKLVYTLAGNSAWLCVLIAGVAITALMPIAIDGKVTFVLPLTGGVYLCLVLYRLAESMAILKTSGFIAAVLFVTVVLSAISAYYGMRGGAIYAAVCFIPVIVVFVVCCLLGIKEYEPTYLIPVIDKGLYGFVIGTLSAFSVMSAVLIPAVMIDNKYKCSVTVTCGIGTAALTLSALLGTMAFGSTTSQYLSVIAEISKNVSVGKFFQRLEGLADASYILTATAVIVILAAVIGDGATGFTKKHFRAVIASVFAGVGALLAYHSIRTESVYNVIQTVVSLSGVLVVMMLLVSRIKLKKSVLLSLALIPMMLMCSCNASREIESQTYIVITAYDSGTGRISFVTEDGSGMNMYSVTADSIEDAARLLQKQKSVSLSFEQMGLLLIDNKCTDVSKWIDGVITSDIPNSVTMLFTKGDQEEIYNNQTTKCDSAFDYVSKLISTAKQEGSGCLSVTDVNTQLAENQKATIGLIDESGYIAEVQFNKEGII